MGVAVQIISSHKRMHNHIVGADNIRPCRANGKYPSIFSIANKFYPPTPHEQKISANFSHCGRILSAPTWTIGHLQTDIFRSHVNGCTSYRRGG